ncbi:hypothetical protein E4T47_08263 [Aureobasidium subglaciale]|nr:hypothetical protein E4T47_08263 [Aureobasidium subglaciale]
MPLFSLLFFDLFFLFFILRTNHTNQIIEGEANTLRLCQHHPSPQHQSNLPHCLTSLYNHPQPTTSLHPLHQVQTNLHTHYPPSFPKYQTTPTHTTHNKTMAALEFSISGAPVNNATMVRGYRDKMCVLQGKGQLYVSSCTLQAKGRGQLYVSSCDLQAKGRGQLYVSSCSLQRC